jgi:hypothetical protein
MSDFDIGKQARIDIVANGAVLASQQITMFEAKQEVISLTHRPLNGPTRRKKLPDGWNFSYDIDRLGPQFDDFFAGQEEVYWNGGVEAQVFITQTIAEQDGSVSQYRFEGICQEFDAGSYKQDDTVKQKVSGYASRRRRVV